MISSGEEQGYLARYDPSPQYTGIEPLLQGAPTRPRRRVAAAISSTHPVAYA